MIEQTQLFDCQSKKLTKKLNISLQRMNTSYVDMYFIHYLSDVKKELTEQDQTRMRQGIVVLKEILAASGAKRVVESPMYFGLHLMGGARMGLDDITAAVDPDFRLKNQKNIFAQDEIHYWAVSSGKILYNL